MSEGKGKAPGDHTGADELAGTSADGESADGETAKTSAGAKPVKGGPALHRVTPDSATRARQRRRRKLYQGVIVTFVLIAAWILIMVGIQFLRTGGYNFRAETEHILEMMRDGKAEQVYRDASPRFQQLMIADRFLELASDINQTLGGFRRLMATKLIESISRSSGNTRRVKATIEFDNGQTTGTFSYHWHEQQWKLLRISIDLPDDLARQVIGRSETRAARKEAPKEVYDLAESILELDRDGKFEQIWREASRTFQESIDLSTFIDVQEERRRVLGNYVRILDTLQSARNANRMQATVAAVVQYQEARATVTLGFIKIDGTWGLAHYKVVMPPLRIPQVSSEPPPPEE